MDNNLLVFGVGFLALGIVLRKKRIGYGLIGASAVTLIAGLLYGVQKAAPVTLPIAPYVPPRPIVSPTPGIITEEHGIISAITTLPGSTVAIGSSTLTPVTSATGSTASSYGPVSIDTTTVVSFNFNDFIGKYAKI